ncbi:hypothetical protein KIN20_027391 [Parelaphostrongylus tenuis]|uniref:Uncharacterized protein n=1 Tax=Parelaphostrongylus tenuis TaxID=148309 RepID=A0AAD5QZD8_PARTN|nr:hypothetical protein KIN20_027391 [Parelaphostrongylus tenuis]
MSETELRVLTHYCWKRQLSTRGAAKEICGAEDDGIASTSAAVKRSNHWQRLDNPFVMWCIGRKSNPGRPQGRNGATLRQSQESVLTNLRHLRGVPRGEGRMTPSSAQVAHATELPWTTDTWHHVKPGKVELVAGATRSPVTPDQVIVNDSPTCAATTLYRNRRDIPLLPIYERMNELVRNNADKWRLETCSDFHYQNQDLVVDTPRLRRIHM